MMNFVLPPRADRAIPTHVLPWYERNGYVAQIKKNGTYNVTFVRSDGDVKVLKRDGSPHLAWKMDDRCREFFTQFRDHQPVLCSELLHSKVPGIRDVHYIHDLLFVDGERLIGTTYAERYRRLLDLVLPANAVETPGYWIIGERVWLARNFEKGFVSLFQSLTDPEDEGLVLKKPQGKWYPNNNTWSVKVRRRGKNNSF